MVRTLTPKKCHLMYNVHSLARAGITFQFCGTTRTNSEILALQLHGFYFFLCLSLSFSLLSLCSGVLQFFGINNFNVWNHLFFIPLVCCVLLLLPMKQGTRIKRKTYIYIYGTPKQMDFKTNVKWNFVYIS